MEFKQKFIEKYSKLTNFEEYKKYAFKFLRKSIRINTLKISVKEFKEKFKDYQLTQIPWCKEGFWIEKENLVNTQEHKKGYFFIQSAASMIPAIILNPKSSETVLDLCASPGAKTTQLASLMKNQGIIIANDISKERLFPLIKNLQRCNVANTITTLHKGEYFPDLKFDKILVDAPCSASGTIRGPTYSSLKTIKIWNPRTIKRLSKLQKKLITKAFSLLKTNGILVYSTCSLEPEEDERVIEYLLKNNSNGRLEKINLYPFKTKSYLKIWPQDYDTEGFFIAKIKKLI